MDTAERRVVGALLLLLGVSFLAVAAYTGEIGRIVEMLKTAFAP
ncbi:MAG: hypothetical protein QXJ02_06430 [Candidatus Bathyarchaeia archaeon]